VPDGPKAAKNRLHLDIKPVSRGQVDELDRLLALGARRAMLASPRTLAGTCLLTRKGTNFASASLTAASGSANSAGAGTRPGGSRLGQETPR
jgi:hypothetical protein